MATGTGKIASKGRVGDGITVLICALLIGGGMFTASNAAPRVTEAPVRGGANVLVLEGSVGESIGDGIGASTEPKP